MKTYIGTKIVNAQPLTEGAFLNSQKKVPLIDINDELFLREGYFVEYEDGYKSWSPKDTFERCYREITKPEKQLMSNG